MDEREPTIEERINRLDALAKQLQQESRFQARITERRDETVIWMEVCMAHIRNGRAAAAAIEEATAVLKAYEAHFANKTDNGEVD